jgi:hypothetical protein
VRRSAVSWVDAASGDGGGRSCARSSTGEGRRQLSNPGHAYVAAMQARDGGTPNHAVWDVQNVGHDGDSMLTSPCGLKALFDLPGCEADR